jgi:hypothetical protein
VSCAPVTLTISFEGIRCAGGGATVTEQQMDWRGVSIEGAASVPSPISLQHNLQTLYTYSLEGAMAPLNS